MPPRASTPSHLTRSQVVAWRNAVFLVFALPGIAFASWVSRLPAMRDQLEIGVDEVGLLVFGLAAGSILGLIGSGPVVARFGARRTIIGGVCLMAAGLLLVSVGTLFGPNYWIVFCGLGIFGSGAGGMEVAMNVSGAAIEGALHRSMLPLFHAFFSFGTMIGAGAGALAELVAVPIATHLVVVAIVISVGLAAVQRFLQSEKVSATDVGPAESRPSRGWRDRLGVWREPRTLLLGVIVLGAAFAEGSANDWLALAMVDGHGVDNATGALVFGLFVTAMTAGRLGGVLLLDRFGRVAVLRGSFVLAAVGLGLLIAVPNAWVAAAGAVLWGLGAALGLPVGISAAADDLSHAHARVSAVATIGYLAFLAGPPVIGLLGDAVGLLPALLPVLVLCAAGFALSGVARENRTWSTAPSAPRP